MDDQKSLGMENLLAAVRHTMTGIGGYMVSLGFVADAASWEPIVGAVVTLVGFGWSVARKMARAAS